MATGLGALAFGHPFLTTHTAHATLPLIGEIHLPSAAPCQEIMRFILGRLPRLVT